MTIKLRKEVLLRYRPIKGQFVRCVRRVNGINLFFWTKDTVYATYHGNNYLYIRVDGHTANFYTNHWHKFVTYAKHGNGLTIAKLNRKAAEHEITITVPSRLPDDIVKVLPERSDW